MSRHNADQEYIHSMLFLILPKAGEENKESEMSVLTNYKCFCLRQSKKNISKGGVKSLISQIYIRKYQVKIQFCLLGKGMNTSPQKTHKI